MDEKLKEISFYLMVDASPIALILVNSIGKISFLNQHAEDLFLYRKNELIGQDIDVLFPEIMQQDYSDLFKKYTSDPGSRTVINNQDLYAIKKTGITFPVEIGLNPIVTVDGTLILAAVVDITERKKANEQFRLVVESAPNSMILVDSSGKIVLINKQTENLFGYKRDELIGKNIEILVPERLKKEHPAHRMGFHANPQTRPMGAGRDLFAIKKDGTEIPVEIGLNPIEKDNSTFVLASVIDITERKKNEEAIRLYTKQIEDKNNELEQFSYIASHDLREPLNSIRGLIYMMLDDQQNKPDDKTLSILKMISNSATRMSELITGLLEYARIGNNREFKKVDLNPVLTLVLNDLEDSIQESNATIKITKLPVLLTLEIEIRLLFQNLISNALKFRKPGVDPEIFISAEKDNSGWIFSVKDNGIGIPAEKKEEVFIIFQRLHNRSDYEGTGIGLAHCRKIVELHDGRIWVESEPGIGSTFYFFIPSKISV